MTRRRQIMLYALPAVLIGAPILAQVIKGFDANAPVDYDADRMDIQDEIGKVFLVGNVHIRQPGIELRAQKVTGSYTKPGGGIQLNRVDADGGVVFNTPTQVAHGDTAIYDLNQKLITVVGHVNLQQGSDTLNGQRLVIELATGRAVVDGQAAGGAQISEHPDGSNGRVSGHFLVPQRKP